MPPIKKEELLKFQKEIERIVYEKDIPYLEAILEFCQEEDIDFDSVPKLLSDSLKQKVEDEANEMSLLKDSLRNRNRLPV